MLYKQKLSFSFKLEKQHFLKKIKISMFQYLQTCSDQIIVVKIKRKRHLWCKHNVYQSSHSIKNYYTTTQIGIRILNMNHIIRMARKNNYNKFLMPNWYFEFKHFQYTLNAKSNFLVHVGNKRRLEIKVIRLFSRQYGHVQHLGLKICFLLVSTLVTMTSLLKKCTLTWLIIIYRNY